jgi:hypothetical protein
MVDIIDEIKDPSDGKRKLIIPLLDVDRPSDGIYEHHGVAQEEYEQAAFGELSEDGRREGEL